jgi:hypothetical protein
MLLARAVSAVARAGASDVLAGVSYVPEELGEQPEIVEAERISLPSDGAVAPFRQREVVDVPLPGDEPAPAKRRRRTKAEMEEARRLEEEAKLAGQWDPEGEERQETAVAEANEEEWVNAWLIDLDQAIEDKDLGAIGVLGSKASAGNRKDLLKQARDAWNDVHLQDSA